MNIVFAHDHKLRFFDNKYFTTGGLSDNITSRYTSLFGNLTILCRAINIQAFDDKVSEVKNPDVDIAAIHSSSLLISSKDKRKFKAIIDNADGVIVRLPSVIGWIVYKYAKKKNKPIFVELVTCPWDSLWNHSLKGKIMAPIMYLRTKIAVRKSDYVLYVTQSFLQKRYPTEGVHIGCSDVELLNISQDILEKRRDSLKKQRKEFVLGTLAAVDTKFKGQQYVIQAISILKKQGIICQYKLAGGGDNSYLRNQAKKYKVDELVLFDGIVPHKDVFNWIDSLDLYIQPSLQEGLPRALVEAMSRACPAIGSTAGGIPELLNSNFIFPKKNVCSIVRLISQLHVSELEIMAEQNFEKSKGYTKEYLDSIREGFYIEFKESLGNA